VSIALLLVSVAIVALARSGVRRPASRGPMWVTAMAAAELAPWLLPGVLLLGGGFYALGWAGGPAGTAALVLLGISAALFGVMIVQSARSRGAVERAVGEFLGRPVSVRLRAPLRLLLPVSRPGRGVSVTSGLRYGAHERHLVDRIARDDLTAPAPVLVHVHGGSWTRGTRDSQARPWLHRMARDGWVVLAPSYRLSPEATFPDPVEDIRLCVEWVQANAGELGVDPSFVALAGGSAGAQVATVAAFSWPDIARICIPLYGVHDLLRSDGTTPLWPYLVSEVMQSRPEDDPERWGRASPSRSAPAERPPFFVVHGATDTLVPQSASARLVEALREAGDTPVGYLPLPWGNHGFDYFTSIRSLYVADGLAMVLAAAYERSRA